MHLNPDNLRNFFRNKTVIIISHKLSTVKYADNFIVEWDLDSTHQSVKLNNGIELEFTLKGKFLRIDN